MILEPPDFISPCFVHPCVYFAGAGEYGASAVDSLMGFAMSTTTRAFKKGNSQAVWIPADLAYERTDIELEIERVGDELRIRPVRRSLSGVLLKFARFSHDFMVEGRGSQRQAPRDAL